MKKIREFLLRHELLIIILCLVALFRLPSLLEPYWYGDEGIYLTVGNGVRHGLALYRDIHDNKPPGIYLLAALAGSLFWFRLLLLVWNLASIAVFSWIAEHLLPAKQRVWKLATLATFLFAFLPFAAEGNIANGEIFMVLPTLIGMGLLLKMRTVSQKKHILSLSAFAGLSFSLAFLIKVPSLFDAVAAGIFFFLVVPQVKVFKVKERFTTLLRSIFSLPPWIFGVAFFAPILISILYYGMIGAGNAYLRAALLQNVGYLSSWGTGSQDARNIVQSGLKNRAILLLATSVILFVGAPLLTSETLLVLFWFAFALFGVLLSERPYPHYLIQAIPALALLIPLCVSLLMRLKHPLKKQERASHVLSTAALGLCLVSLIVSFVSIKFWNYSIPPYFQNYFKFVTKQISRDQYLSFFDASLPEQYKVATYIAEHTGPNDRIFIWGDLPTLYALTRRLPPGRYTSAYHIKDFNGFDETYKAIEKTEPAFILIDKRASPFPKLQQLLTGRYIVISQSKTFTLYRRFVSH